MAKLFIHLDLKEWSSESCSSSSKMTTLRQGIVVFINPMDKRDNKKVGSIWFYFVWIKLFGNLLLLFGELLLVSFYMP